MCLRKPWADLLQFFTNPFQTSNKTGILVLKIFFPQRKELVKPFFGHQIMIT